MKFILPANKKPRNAFRALRGLIICQPTTHIDIIFNLSGVYHIFYIWKIFFFYHNLDIQIPKKYPLEELYTYNYGNMRLLVLNVLKDFYILGSN